MVDPLGLAGGNTTVTLNNGQTFNGTSGSGNMHPALANFIPTDPVAVLGVKSAPPKDTRGKCAEVDALSQVLRAKKVPDNASPEQVKEALKDIKKIDTTEKKDGKRERAGDPKQACGYCKKMMADLGIAPGKIING